MKPVFSYNHAEVMSVHDGDTVALELDLGFDIFLKKSLRMDGVDTPELSAKLADGKTADDLQRKAAAVSREFTSALLAPGMVFEVQSIDNKEDKYGGRILGKILLPDGRDVSKLLVDNKFGVPYAGAKKLPWDPAFLRDLAARSVEDVKKLAERIRLEAVKKVK